MTTAEWPDRLTPDEIGALIRTGTRPERPAGWSPAPGADARLDAEADAVLLALARPVEAAPPGEAATSADGDQLGGAVEAGATSSRAKRRRRVPVWVAALVAVPAVAAAVTFTVLAVDSAADAASVRDEVAAIDADIEGLE